MKTVSVFWVIVTVARNRLLCAKMRTTLEMVSTANIAMELIPNNKSLATIAVVLLWKVS